MSMNKGSSANFCCKKLWIWLRDSGLGRAPEPWSHCRELKKRLRLRTLEIGSSAKLLGSVGSGAFFGSSSAALKKRGEKSTARELKKSAPEQLPLRCSGMLRGEPARLSSSARYLQAEWLRQNVMLRSGFSALDTIDWDGFRLEIWMGERIDIMIQCCSSKQFAMIVASLEVSSRPFQLLFHFCKFYNPKIFLYRMFTFLLWW